MGWETRGNQRYYYRSVRVRGRVRKEYVGPGQVAELIDGMNADKKAARDAAQARVRAAMDELARLESLITPLDELARIAVEGAMAVAGYHRIKRGPWRKRREQAEDGPQTDRSDTTRAGRDAGTAEGIPNVDDPNGTRGQ